MKMDLINGLSVYRFETFDQIKVSHGFFARKGGVSPEPWESLNQGGTVGDARANVIENRQRAFSTLGRQVKSIFDVWQVHGTEVICANAPRPLDEKHELADAIVTDNPEVTLFMRFADCVPILVYDPIKSVVGIIHAGWQGTVKKIVSLTIEVMAQRYHSNPASIFAGIGPSIGVCHYQVGEEVITAVKSAFGSEAESLLQINEGKTFFDLWGANKLLLTKSGVKAIEVAKICTACHTDDWFSHRAELGKTGRFGAAIYLREGSSNAK